MRTRLVVGLVGAGAAVVLVGGPAVAGEVTGNGTPLEVKGNSICAFSGQNDEFQAGEPNAPRVQSFGQEVRGFAAVQMVDEAAREGIGGSSHEHGVGIPGAECNGSLAPLR